jgi:hypothetical protein
MNLKFKNSLFILSLVIILWPSFSSLAQTGFDITIQGITNLENGRATLKWNTPHAKTLGTIYFGEDSTNLDKSTSYGEYSYYHEMTMGGLEVDQTYYYKIVAFDEERNKVESYIRNFSTKGMIDNVKPRITEHKVLQVIDDAVAISWQTDEKTTATIAYGIIDNDQEPTEYNKSTSYKSYSLAHEKFIYNLKPNTTYSLMITAKDKAGNKASSFLMFKTKEDVEYYKKLTINNIEPTSTNSTEVYDTQVTISWKTNMISRGRVYYGTKSGSLKNQVTVDQDLRRTDHRAVLTNLKPQTTYFFKIEANSSFGSSSTKTAELSFTTKHQTIVIEDIGEENNEELIGNLADFQISDIDPKLDTDRDGLKDVYEMQIGTSIYSVDSDNDGYNDYLEVANGYNPKGAGKLSIAQYYKPRINNAIEQKIAIELRVALEEKLGKLRLDAKYWPTFVSAYIYGDYPLNAIVQAIKLGGKTVHPSIVWQDWRNTDTYKRFIGENDNTTVVEAKSEVVTDKNDGGFEPVIVTITEL